MSLRVIAGKARGRKLKSVPGDTTRPVMDRVKEALFNIITGDVIDSNWWDLFAGNRFQFAALGLARDHPQTHSTLCLAAKRFPCDAIMGTTHPVPSMNLRPFVC